MRNADVLIRASYPCCLQRHARVLAGARLEMRLAVKPNILQQADGPGESTRLIHPNFDSNIIHTANLFLCRASRCISQSETLDGKSSSRPACPRRPTKKGKNRVELVGRCRCCKGAGKACCLGCLLCLPNTLALLASD